MNPKTTGALWAGILVMTLNLSADPETRLELVPTIDRSGLCPVLNLRVHSPGRNKPAVVQTSNDLVHWVDWCSVKPGQHSVLVPFDLPARFFRIAPERRN